MADPTVEEPENDAGVWSTPDGGRTWVLDEPSQAWLDARADLPEPVEELSVAEIVASLVGED